MSAYTYHEIDFEISVKEGFYHYQQKVSPAYRVGNLTDLDWEPSIVVHRLPGHFRQDQWFISEQTTGNSIEIPKTTSREAAVRHAIARIQEIGRENYQKALAHPQTKKARTWKPNRQLLGLTQSIKMCYTLVIMTSINFSINLSERRQPLFSDYCQFLLAGFQNFTQTYFADHTQNADHTQKWSHDQLNRLLNTERIPARELWRSVKNDQGLRKIVDMISLLG